jgi:hypothetical protein
MLPSAKRVRGKMKMIRDDPKQAGELHRKLMAETMRLVDQPRWRPYAEVATIFAVAFVVVKLLA